MLRYDGYVDMNRSVHNPGEGMFKNEYIDIIKSKPDPTFKNKCDPNKRILESERYELKTLESEVKKYSSQPANFHGLEPFELAEFRIGN